MSKIGRKPIIFSSAVKVSMEGNRIAIKGAKDSLVHELPQELDAALNGNALSLIVAYGYDKDEKKVRMLWGLHRALLANEIKGLEKGFEQRVDIVGLGYKAVLQGTKLVFSLGYTNKIEYELPDKVKVELDKTGQRLLVKSEDKFLLGNVCDIIRSFRPTEPYKGTGIMWEGEVIIRKAGKAKGS